MELGDEVNARRSPPDILQKRDGMPSDQDLVIPQIHNDVDDEKGGEAASKKLNVIGQNVKLIQQKSRS